MIATTWAARALMGALLATSGLHAQTLEDDEAHIAELIRAELARVPLADPATAIDPASTGPAPVIAEVIAPAPSAPPEPEEWLAPQSSQDQGMPFADLANFLGRRVTIVSTGERVHRGIVSSANAREVTLRVRRSGGNASYTLKRQQVVRIEPR